MTSESSSEPSVSRPAEEGRPSRRPPRGLNLLAALLLFAAAVALFLPTMDFSHLRLDDAGYTVNCPFVKGGLSAANVIAACLDPGNGAIWMPLTYVTYMADVTLLGGDWAAFHFTNVMLHALNALLLFALLGRLLRAFGCAETGRTVLAAFCGALLWTVHPMRAEAVAWIAARKEELWTLFALLGLLAWLRFLAGAGRAAYLVAFAWFLLACLSKPTALCFPFVAFAVQRFAHPSRRVRPVAYLPFALVACALGLLTVHSQSHPTGGPAIDIYDTSLGWRLLNAAVSLGLYVGRTLVPADVHFDYRAIFEGFPLHGARGLVLAGAALVAWGVAFAVRGRPLLRRAAGLSLALFLLPLAPALGVFGIVGDHAMADRYAYLASAAFAFLIALGCARTPFRGAGPVLGLLAVAAVAGEVCLARPVLRSFRDDLAAFSRVLAFDPDHWRALHFVGAEYCARQKRFDEGLRMIRRSLALSPRPSTAATLAYLLAYRAAPGDLAEVRRLGAEVAANPKRDREGLMLDALGVTALREGDDRSAVACFSAALAAPQRQHTDTHARLNLGIALANIGCDREAQRVLTPLRKAPDKWVRARATALALTIARGGKRSRIPFQGSQW